MSEHNTVTWERVLELREYARLAATQACYEIMRRTNCAEYRYTGKHGWVCISEDNSLNPCAECWQGCPLHSKDALPHCPLHKGEKPWDG